MVIDPDLGDRDGDAEDDVNGNDLAMLATMAMTTVISTLRVIRKACKGMPRKWAAAARIETKLEADIHAGPPSGQSDLVVDHRWLLLSLMLALFLCPELLL